MLFIGQYTSVEILLSTEKGNARNSAFNIQDFLNSADRGRIVAEFRFSQTVIQPIDPAKNVNISLLSTVLDGRPNETLGYLSRVGRNQIQISATLFERVAHVTEGDAIRNVEIEGWEQERRTGQEPGLSPNAFTCQGFWSATRGGIRA